MANCGTPTPRDEEGWREIHPYAYVGRRFDDLWPLLATEPNGVLGDGPPVPLGRGTSDLHAHLGGVDVARTVAMHFSGLVCGDERAGLAVRWEAAHHPRMFPVLEDDDAFTIAGTASGPVPTITPRRAGRALGTDDQ